MMTSFSRRGRVLAVVGVLALAFAGAAEARKGGSSGSRIPKDYDGGLYAERAAAESPSRAEVA